MKDKYKLGPIIIRPKVLARALAQSLIACAFGFAFGKILTIFFPIHITLLIIFLFYVGAFIWQNYADKKAEYRFKGVSGNEGE